MKTEKQKLPPGELVTRCERVATRFPKGTIWKHRVSGYLYRVSGACLLEVNAAPAVLYTPLVPEDATDRVVWARAIDEFARSFDEVEP